MGRRHGAWIASVAIHLALAAWLLSLPERTPRDDEPRFTAIEIIELAPTVADEGDGAASVPAAPTLEAPTEQPAPAARGRKRSEPTAPAGRPASDTETPRSDAPAAAPLALHGLRGPTTRAVPDPSSAVLDSRSAGDRYGPDEAPSGSDQSFETPHDAGFRRNKKAELVYDAPAKDGDWSAKLLPDGRMQFKDHLAPALRPGGIVGPGLKEWIPAALGFDFWRAHKRRLLQSTRELRLRMAVEHAEKNIDRQLGQLYRDLLEIWQDQQETASTRREQIFQRWDECVESLSVELGDFDEETSKIDALRANAGAQARARICEFVRKHLPANSEDAFSESELRDMNRRRASRERFDPYGDRP